MSVVSIWTIERMRDAAVGASTNERWSVRKQSLFTNGPGIIVRLAPPGTGLVNPVTCLGMKAASQIVKATCNHLLLFRS